MALFRYTGYTEEGLLKKGILDAESLEQAKERLSGFFLTSLQPSPPQCFLKIQSRDLLIFTKDLTELLKAHVPLYDALRSMEEKWRLHKMHEMIIDLCDQVKEGKKLHESMQRYQRVFDRIYLSIVEAGESIGALAPAFSSLVEMIQKKEKMRQKLRSGAAYPIFLAIFAFVLIIAVLTYLVPTMRELLEDRTLHPMTVTVLRASYIVCNYPGQIFIFCASIVLGSAFMLRCIPPKKVSRMVIYLPIIGKLKIHAILARFARTLYFLLKSHLPLVESLAIAKNSMKDPLFESIISRAIEGIMKGACLSEMLKVDPVPHFVVRLIATGEKSGSLTEMVRHVSEMYEEELDRSLEQINTFLQPLLLIVLGLVVGTILLAVLLPLTDVQSMMN